MAGKNEEITVQLLHIDFLVRYALRSVQYNHSAMFVCEVDQRFRVEDKAKNVADLGKSYDFGLVIDFREIFFFKLTGFFIDIDIIQHCTGFLSNSLPGNQIGMMLSYGDDDAVAFFQMGFAVGTGNQIQAFRSITSINYFTCTLGINELANYFFRAIVGFRSCNSEYVRASVRITVLTAVIFIDSFQHRQRFLRGRTIVKIDKWPSGTDSLQYGKIITNQFNVHLYSPLASSLRRISSRASSCSDASRLSTIGRIRDSTIMRRASSWEKPRLIR
ncbi:hypothetical protein SDC9_85065 [bioreactor metagenome]|uniref:Uncharacterized protein n=1 Tax=bioreactor metagenome TaxID=1076179 RepID=A0A644ZC30_9ZZZZ